MNDYKTISIYGTGRYVYLSSPDTKFDKEGKYHVTLEVPKDKAQEAIKEINGVISQEVAKEHKTTPGAKSPMKRATLQYSDEGNIITFKVKSKYKPPIVDRRNKGIDPNISIWKGTTMWVLVELRGYSQTIGIGCSLYLKEVQIDNLVQGTGNGVSHFPDRGEGSSLPGPEKSVY